MGLAATFRRLADPRMRGMRDTELSEEGLEIQLARTWAP